MNDPDKTLSFSPRRPVKLGLKSGNMQGEERATDRWFWLIVVGSIVLLGHAKDTIDDYDIFWHIASGIHQRSFGLEQIDSFAISAKDQVSYFWLFDRVVSVIHEYGRWPAILLFNDLLIFLLTVLVFCCYARGFYRKPQPFVLTLLVFCSIPDLALRPQLISFISSASLILVVEGKWPIVLKSLVIASITILWANIHIYFFLSPLLIGFFALEHSWFPRTDKGYSRPVRSIFLLFPVSFLATLCTPYSFQLYGTLSEMILAGTEGFVGSYVIESRPVEIARTTSWFFFVLAGIGLTLMVRKKRLRSVPVVLFVGSFFLQGILHQRDIPYLGIIALPVLIRFLDRQANFSGIPRKKWSAKPSPVVLMVLIVAVVFRIGTGLLLNGKIDSSLVPVDAVSFIKERNLKGPMLNHWNQGGYLIYALYPRYRVFIDGRITAQSEDVLDDFIVLHTVAKGWEEVIGRRNPGFIVWPNDEPLTGLLGRSSRWRRIYADDVCTVFVPLRIENFP